MKPATTIEELQKLMDEHLDTVSYDETPEVVDLDAGPFDDNEEDS
jgi:hypothetical protein